MKRLNPVQMYFIVTGGMALFESLIFTILGVYYVKVVGLNPLQLVLVGTVVEVTVFLFEVPTGIVADVYSRRLSATLGVFLSGLAFVAQSQFPFFPAILAAEVLHGLGWTFISGALSAWIADEIGEEKVGKVFLRSAQVGQVCGISGTIAGAGLGLIGLNLAVLAGGIGLGLVGLVMAFGMPETGFKPAPRGEVSPWKVMRLTLGEGVRMTRGRPLALTLVATALLYGAFSEGVDRLWEAHFLTDLSFPFFEPVIWFGLIRVGGNVLSFGVTGLLARRVETGNPAALIKALLVLDLVKVGSLAVFGLAGNFWVALSSFWLFGVSRGSSDPLYDACLNQNLDSKVRATVLSMNSLLNALGQFACGPLLGLIGTVAGIPAALAASALVLAPTVFLYGRAWRYTAKTPEPVLAPN